MNGMKRIMAALLLSIAFFSPGYAQILINEIDADTPSYDQLEFIELFDGGTGYTPLDGLVLVLYNGSSDTVYRSFDLNGFSTNGNGYFVIGSVSGADVWVDPGSSGWLQNGADAVALYNDNTANFPVGAVLTTANLVDAVVYDTNDADDTGLLVLLNSGQPQLNEGGAGDKDNHSNQRCSGAAKETAGFVQALSTPGAANTCPSGPAALVINEINADPDATNGDANGDGTVNTTQDEFVEIVNTTDSDIDISGWTLADAVGVRHTFSAGTIVKAQCAVVVFGGGTPTGEFGFTIVQTASSGTLGLNNSGDTITLNDGAIDQAIASYGSQGGDNQSLVLNPELSGSSYVKHSTVAATRFSPGTLTNGSNFVGCSVVADSCGDPATLIHEIQGAGSASPLVGSVHSVEAVVVGDFQDTSTQLSGFYLQEEDHEVDGDPATSEGIFVYDNGFMDVEVGDVVRVKGQVKEHYELTELTSISKMEVCGTGSATAVTVAFPVASADYWEQVEGMLITIPESLSVIDTYNHGYRGEIHVAAGGRLDIPTNVVSPGADANALQQANDLRRIQIDDGSFVSNPLPLPPYIGDDNTLRLGDTVSALTGVLSYSYGEYEIHPTQTVTFARENPRPSIPDDVGGTLRVASFNVLNYFNGDGLGGGFPTPRGADTPEEFSRQRDKIINAIHTMNADIVGLMEIENDAEPHSAIGDLVNGLNTLAGAGTYAFIDTGVIGTDAIKVAMIYKPGTVTPEGAFAILDSSVDPDFNDDKNRPVLLQGFKENATGSVVAVAVNHFKSKGSDCDALGDPDTGDGQGNCNLTRTAAATALVNWLATDPTGIGENNFLIIGDLNAYAKEDPITTITDAGYTNLLADGYSYVFKGQAGYLDHALASTNLASQVSGVTLWHINADEPRALDYNNYNQPALYNPDAFRSSDHDPVIIGLNLLAVNSYCTKLGDNRSRFLPDLDLFRFYGDENEKVTISLVGTSEVGRANLTVVDGIKRIWFYEKATGELPNELSLTLPATGKYYIAVSERYRHARGAAFQGDYCLNVKASANTADSLKASKWVE